MEPVEWRRVKHEKRVKEFLELFENSIKASQIPSKESTKPYKSF